MNKNQHYLSEIMETFAVITLMGLIPTLIFSFYGMNIEGDAFSKVQVSTIAIILIPIAAFLLIGAYFKGWLIPRKVEEPREERGYDRYIDWIINSRVYQGAYKWRWIILIAAVVIIPIVIGWLLKLDIVLM